MKALFRILSVGFVIFGLFVLLGALALVAWACVPSEGRASGSPRSIESAGSRDTF
jgi:phage shock protein PspC (stress-responsive transcriptional regulator)